LGWRTRHVTISLRPRGFLRQRSRIEDHGPFHNRMMCPGCPLHYKTQTNTNTRFPTFCKTLGKYSSPFPELHELLKIAETCKSCAGESPGPLHAHTYLHFKYFGKAQQDFQKNKQKNRKSCKNPLLLIHQGYGKLCISEG
jgi:hypothetical protein